MSLNRVTVQMRDMADNPVDDITFSLMVDTIPPDLNVITPRNGTVIKGPDVAVKGVAEPGCQVIVNGDEVVLEDDGYFDHTIALDEGDRTVHVVARDSFGNEARWDVHVEVAVEEPSPEGDGFIFSVSMIILVAVFVVLLALLMMRRRWSKSSHK